MSEPLLIGNGPSLIGRGLADTIDNWEGKVHRFNYCKPTPDVGSRVDRWWTTDSFKLPIAPQSIMFHTWGKPKDRTIRKLKSLYPDSRVGIASPVYSEWASEISGSTKAHSTGMLALAVLLVGVEYPRVAIAGFDHSGAQYARNDQGGSNHDWEAEKAAVDRLVDEGRVRRL